MDNQRFLTQIEAIRHLMAEGKMNQAVEALRKLSNTIRDSATKDEIISISSKFSRLERDIRDQMVSIADINLKQNQLTGQVLSLLSSLEKGYTAVADNTRIVTPELSKASSSKKGKNNFLIWGIAALVLIVLTFVAIQFLGGKDDTSSLTNCSDKLLTAQSAYIDEAYEKAKRILETLPKTCREQEDAQTLIAKIKTISDQKEETIDTDIPENETPTTVKNKCEELYKAAVLAYQKQLYKEARQQFLEIKQNCPSDSRIDGFLTQVNEKIKESQKPPVEPPTNTDKELARFLLRFNKGYLVHSVNNGVTQLAANNPISYGQDWQVKKLKDYLFHVKQKAWNGFYWQVNTSKKEVHFVRNGTFGQIGGQKSKEKISVKPYPNGEKPIRFQLFFDDFYLVHAPPSTTQVTAEGKVLQRENSWNIRKINNNIYHIKSNAWKSNLFWKVDLTSKRVEMFRGISDFGKADAKSNEYVDATVEVVYK